MDENMSFLTWFLLLSAILLQSAGAKETVIRAHAGTNVILPCPVDIKQCGTLHSVKWYRDTSRIYVFSQAGQVARAEGDATDRMKIDYNETGIETYLQISPVEVEDEAIYKCEITYLEVRENCDVIQIVKLVTLVRPVSVRILGNDGVSISNSTKLSPRNEGSELEVICEAIGGKPIPQITWYSGTNVLKRASYSAHGDDNGVGTGVSKLQLTLSRGDLNARFECRVESEALDEPIISWVSVDVHVRPTKMELSGVKGHVVQGTTVFLMCDVFGARPAAKVRWFNGSIPITDERLVQTVPEDNRDGTFTTKSTLVFVASRWENGRTFNCYAENEVTKSLLEPALHKLLLLDVRFPPVIKVSTTKNVVNETEKVMLSCTYFANPQKLLEATWFKDGKNLTRVRGKHENGNIESPSLHIKNISREDIGEYSCFLKNEVGSEQSEDTLYLDVHFAPDVEVIMEPSTPVKAVDRGNVTLECNVTSGNPPSLRKVRWFLGGELMTELPECNYGINETLGGGPFCGIDPSILSLIRVEESFSGNYTCQGENDAGYGPVSQPKELVVYYPPSPANLRYYPSTVIKKASVTLECSVDHPGRPTNVTYIWYRGSHQIHNITVGNWTIQHASLETRSNFTCIALNEGGQSIPATVSINVLAPPAFIGTLVSYKGVLFSSKNVSLTCRIECFPLCSIIWFKDGFLLDTAHNPYYYVNNTLHPADYNKNDFESIESTLIWNMTNWPNQQLNKSAPHSHYTCASRSKYDVGPHVNFTTEIAIDFPPEDLSVSTILVNVIENEIPHPVKCSGKGRPKLNYLWKRNFTSEPIVKNDVLQLDKMSRSASGSYICEAYNKYGSQTAKVHFNVQYKPECSITITEHDGNPALICTAHANPQKVSFMWRIRESNETYIDYDNFIIVGINSYVILDSSVDTFRTYQCIANNSVGMSIPCERYVAAYQEQSSQIGEPGTLPWYKRWGQEKLILLIASIVALIICVIIVCIVIILLCRKKRANTKYNNPLEMEEREKPDGQSPDTSGQSKWPLKPGVLVHVGKLNSINISQLSPSITPFKTTSVCKTSNLLKYRRNKSKVYARLQRLRDYLGFGSHNHIPSGIKESASGVVTYKKIKTVNTPTPENVNSRKRKKPSYAPNQSSIGDKMRLGTAPPVGSSADPANDRDKGFYENLPFHGMQNQPNKPISVIAPFTQGIPQNFNMSSTSLIPPIINNTIKRHQSFHGFQTNQFTLSNPYLNQPNFFPSNCFQFLKFPSGDLPQYNFQPTLNPFIPINPFSVPPKTSRVVGRREADIRRTASGINISLKPEIKLSPIKIVENKEKRFGSLELKKHKCYSPTFYSMRCKKHAKKRPVVYALPKKVIKDLNCEIIQIDKDKLDDDLYRNLSDSIQIFEQSNEKEKLPIPAPRCKKHKRETIYENVANGNNSKEPNSSNCSSENIDSEISVIEVQVHNESNKQTESTDVVDSSLLLNESKSNSVNKTIESLKEECNITNPFSPKLVGVYPKPLSNNVPIYPANIKLDPHAMKNSPTLKVSPNFIKPKTKSPKGALSLQIQAKKKAYPLDSSFDNPTLIPNNDDNVKENFPLVPQMPIINTTQNKWIPNLTNANQNAFYTLTSPHYKHVNANLPPQYSATIPHPKHTKLIPKGLFQEQLSKSKSFSSKSKHKKHHFQIPLQKCHSFKFQTAESYFQPIKNIHEENLMRNGYVSDYAEQSRTGRPSHKREKPKQKTKGPLVVKRTNDYHHHENVQFPENVQNFVQLQYPQPMLLERNLHSKKPNGVVYADLDMPVSNKKTNDCTKPVQQSKNQKSKLKTEYATLSFNDVGQEIDV